MPTLITSSNAQWQNGDTLPEIKSLFPDVAIHRRTGIINCYEDPTFRAAFEEVVKKTGRYHIIIAGVTIGTCCAFPTLSLLNDGYKVFPVVDACGAWNRYETEAAMHRMANAGAELVTTFALACELQADWKLPSLARCYARMAHRGRLGELGSTHNRDCLDGLKRWPPFSRGHCQHWKPPSSWRIMRALRQLRR